MKIYNCLHCGAENKAGHSKSNKFCNNKCQNDYQIQVKIDKWLEEGNWVTKNKQLPPWMKRYVRDRDGCCTSCGISEWNGAPIVLDVDHIDGMYTNNNIDNLRSLCPNCHSQTDTYKNRNYGSGRTLAGILKI